MTEHNEGSADPNRPSGASEIVVIGGVEHWYIPESGTVTEVEETDTSDTDSESESDE